MSNSSNGNKKALITTVIVVPILVLVVGTIFWLGSKEEKTVTQTLYNEAKQMVVKTKIPTYFDDSTENPIQYAYLSSTVGGKSEESDAQASEKVQNDLLMDLILYDEKSKQTVNYTVVNYDSEYNYIVNNGGKSVLLENNQEVFEYQNGYFWKLKDGLYASVFSHNETPDKKVLVDVILSVGNSKLNVFKKMKYIENRATILEPFYKMPDSKKAYSVVMEYTQADKKPVSTLAIYYEDFVMYQSYDLDYTGTDFMGEYTEESYEKFDYKGHAAYLDLTYHSVHYTADDLSIWLLPNGEDVNKDEMVKVLKSMQ